MSIRTLPLPAETNKPITQDKRGTCELWSTTTHHVHTNRKIRCLYRLSFVRSTTSLLSKPKYPIPSQWGYLSPTHAGWGYGWNGHRSLWPMKSNTYCRHTGLGAGWPDGLQPDNSNMPAPLQLGILLCAPLLLHLSISANLFFAVKYSEIVSQSIQDINFHKSCYLISRHRFKKPGQPWHSSRPRISCYWPGRGRPPP